MTREQIIEEMARAIEYAACYNGNGEICNSDVIAQAAYSVLEGRMKELEEALRPFAERHHMGDQYVSFAPRLIEQARATLQQDRG